METQTHAADPQSGFESGDVTSNTRTVWSFQWITTVSLNAIKDKCLIQDAQQEAIAPLDNVGSQHSDRQHTNSEFVAGQVGKGFSELAWVHSLQGSPARFPFSKSLKQANQGCHHTIALQCMGSFVCSDFSANLFDFGVCLSVVSK